MVKLITDQDQFKQWVLDYDGITIVDFYTDICQPCRMMVPTLKKLSTKYRMYKVNGMMTPSICRNYSISKVPVLLFFKNGRLMKRLEGLSKEKDIVQVMNELQAEEANVS